MKYPSVYPLDEINKLTLCQKHHISRQNGCFVMQIEHNTNICCALEFTYILEGICEHSS